MTHTADIDAPREAYCDNAIEQDDGTATGCDGRLWFKPGDREAPCDTCGARCGRLVASYVTPPEVGQS